ncbi:hypothetical protein HYV81_06535 [Candidatus Woesearchaeota archaeon]|nr:hypothetical protein [Candidatus Woesearchaeota archaeon]
MFHDIGETQLPSEKGKGADWEKPDKRMAHRHVGVKIAREVLQALNKQMKMAMPGQYIDEIARLIMIHDDPYVGIPIDTEDKNGIALRAADRSYVPSVVSFYKDFLNYKDDKDPKRRALTPEQFVKQRIAFFGLEDVVGGVTPEDAHLIRLNEGGRVEKPYTPVDKEIIAQMLLNRRGEVYDIAIFQQPVIENFASRIEEFIWKEMKWLIDKAREHASSRVVL